MGNVKEYEAFWANSGGHSQVADTVMPDVAEYYKEAIAALLEKENEEEAAGSASSSSGEKRKRDSE